MKKITILMLGFFIIIASTVGLLTKSEVSAEGKSDFVKGEILVKFKEGAGSSEMSRVHKQLGGEVKETIPNINVQVVAVKDNVGRAVSAYAREGLVEYVEPNYIAEVLGYFPDDEHFGLQWAFDQFSEKDIDAPEAWEITPGSSDVLIAILDTGINVTHEDLQGKTADSEDFSGTDIEDWYGHGTHVAGIAAASTDNGKGVAGTGFNSRLLIGKVCTDNGSCPYSWVADGIIWSANNGAKVISMSLGGSRKSKTMESAVNYAWNDKNVVLVAAAGNSNNPSPTYPAKYKNVISVAATDENDNKASFSSYGDWVDVAAPGVNIYSTFPNHSYAIGKSLNYDFGSGTSMSTPIVAGIAGLVWSTDLSGDSNAKVRAQVEKNAEAINGTGTYWINGRVNAFLAVTVDQQPDTDDGGGNGGGRKCYTPPCNKK